MSYYKVGKYKWLEVKMTPVYTIVAAPAGSPGGVEIGRSTPDRHGVEVG